MQSSEEEKTNREKAIMDILVMLYNDQYGTNLTYSIMTEKEIKAAKQNADTVI